MKLSKNFQKYFIRINSDLSDLLKVPWCEFTALTSQNLVRLEAELQRWEILYKSFYRNLKDLGNTIKDIVGNLTYQTNFCRNEKADTGSLEHLKTKLELLTND
jgi:hypothetical protein